MCCCLVARGNNKQCVRRHSSNIFCFCQWCWMEPLLLNLSHSLDFSKDTDAHTHAQNTLHTNNGEWYGFLHVCPCFCLHLSAFLISSPSVHVAAVNEFIIVTAHFIDVLLREVTLCVLTSVVNKLALWHCMMFLFFLLFIPCKIFHSWMLHVDLVTLRLHALP